VIEHASCVVQNEAVDLTERDDDLERVTERVLGGDQGCDNKAEGAPGELSGVSLALGFSALGISGPFTAVMVSMHSTKGSEVRYRESDRAYSFHS
jgi:hypothetical protein